MSNFPKTQNSCIRNFTYCRVSRTDANGIAALRLDNDREAPAQLSPEQQKERELRARQDGIREGEERTHANVKHEIERERASIAAAIARFAAEQRSYFHAVENEVVQLALSIATKVLHREAQVDPLLLAGIVRVALDKLREGTNVTLRVHPTQKQTWEQYVQQNGVPHTVEILADNAMEEGACSIQTSLGVTHVSIEGQLKEIERGLTDLLAQRPQLQS